jgi:hypothetical protein
MLGTKFSIIEFLKSEYFGLLKLSVPPLAIAAGVCLLLNEKILISNSKFSARNWPTVRANDVPGQCIYQTLLLAVVSLVFVNTLIYGEDSFDQAEVGAGHSRVVHRFSLACVVVALIWGSDIIWGNLGLSNHSHEYIALIVFVVFVFMDWSLYNNGRSQLALLKPPVDDVQGRKRAELALKAENFLLQLLFVDLPVVLGIGVTLILLNVFLDGSPALGVRGDRSAEAYLRGLATGAVVMHMAASQAIFFFIYTKYHVQKFRLGSLSNAKPGEGRD